MSQSPSDWMPTTLGTLGFTYGGLTGKTKADFGSGEARYITFLNVMNNPVIDSTMFERVRVHPSENQTRAERGDLFFNGSSETPAEVGMCSLLDEQHDNLYLNSFCFGFRLFPGVAVNRRYLAYYLRSGEGRRLLFALAQGATRYNLSKTALKNIVFSLPPLEEQNRIATVISDMDNEIAAHEARLAKSRLLKVGVMQALLSGGVRLS